MNDQQPFEDVFLEVLRPLLDAIKVFETAARYIGPNTLDSISERLLATHQKLRAASEGLGETHWPPEAEAIRESVSKSYGHALRSLATLADSNAPPLDMMSIYRAIGARSRMCEAIYPLADYFSLIHRFFLDARKQDLPRHVNSQSEGNSSICGVHHVANDRKERGGFSIYVPESYDPNREYPVVFAMHGGSGHGSSFLWSWLRTARTEELVVVSPTSVGGTWAIMGPDQDTPNLLQILKSIRQMVNVDETKLLLTGMSDGGTFTYVSGCLEDSPFTHLAPCSASFHPMLIEMMSKERLKGLPICITHGALDWMFTVDIAQTAEYSFNEAGAKVLYREIPDLAHTYPEDANPELVDWFLIA